MGPSRPRTSLTADYWRLCSALGISRLGSVLSGTTLLLWIYNRSGHSAIAVGWIVAAQFLAPLAVSPIVAQIIDRHNRFRLMVLSDVASVLLGGGIIASVYYHHILPAVILVGVMSGFGAMFQAAENAVIPALVDKSQIGRANSYNNSISQATFVVGPGIAAVLFELAGPLYSLVFDTLSFVASAVLLAGLRRLATGKPVAVPGIESYGAKQGLGKIASVIVRRAPLRFVIIGLAVMVLSAGISNTVGIAFLHVDLHVNTGFIGLFAATNGICQLAVSGILPRLADRWHPERMVGVSLVVMAGGGWIYATSSALPVTLCGVAIIALANAPFNVGVSVITQTAVPDALRGRFSLIVNVITNSMFFVGSQGSVWLTRYSNPRVAFMVSAGLLALAALIVLLPQTTRLPAPRATGIE